MDIQHCEDALDSDVFEVVSEPCSVSPVIVVRVFDKTTANTDPTTRNSSSSTFEKSNVDLMKEEHDPELLQDKESVDVKEVEVSSEPNPISPVTVVRVFDKTTANSKSVDVGRPRSVSSTSSTHDSHDSKDPIALPKTKRKPPRIIQSRYRQAAENKAASNKLDAMKKGSSGTHVRVPSTSRMNSSTPRSVGNTTGRLVKGYRIPSQSPQLASDVTTSSVDSDVSSIGKSSSRASFIGAKASTPLVGTSSSVRSLSLDESVIPQEEPQLLKSLGPTKGTNTTTLRMKRSVPLIQRASTEEREQGKEVELLYHQYLRARYLDVTQQQNHNLRKKKAEEQILCLWSAIEETRERVRKMEEVMATVEQAYHLTQYTSRLKDSLKGLADVLPDHEAQLEKLSEGLDNTRHQLPIKNISVGDSASQLCADLEDKLAISSNILDKLQHFTEEKEDEVFKASSCIRNIEEMVEEEIKCIQNCNHLASSAYIQEDLANKCLEIVNNLPALSAESEMFHLRDVFLRK